MPFGFVHYMLLCQFLSLLIATQWLIDVLWGQPIKLIQLASNSELRENQWTTLFSLKFFPLIASGPWKPQKLTAFKIKYENFRPNIFNSSLKNGYFGALIFQEIEFFEHLKYNFKTSWPQKISIFKKHFTAKITLILMIKKMPLTFLDVEK